MQSSSLQLLQSTAVRIFDIISMKRRRDEDASQASGGIVWTSVGGFLPRISLSFVHMWLAKRKEPTVGIVIRKGFRRLQVTPLLERILAAYLLNFPKK